MKIFILEDDQTRIDKFVQEWGTKADLTIAKSFDAAVKKYKGGYDLVCLDHDLGGQQYVGSEDPNTGYAFTKWLVGQYPIKRDNQYVPAVIIHSYNPSGATNMGGLLMKAGWSLVQLIPFGPQVFRTVLIGGD